MIKIDSGSFHSCAIKEISPPTSTPNIGTLNCWGDNHFGQSDIPSSFNIVVVIDLADYHTCAISPRMLACWGNNQFGQTTVPVAFRRAYAVHTASHTCALVYVDIKSSVGCWGDNANGEATVPAFI